jgi:hypothetical protein
MKVGEHEKIPKSPACEFKKPVALVLTYNRPGLLIGTVRSFLETTKGVPLHVFDDGSEVENKSFELQTLEGLEGVKVHRLPHQGFVASWRAAFTLAKAIGQFDSVVALEDDIVFARGWLDVLKNMQAGIANRGFQQGLVSCFMPHEHPQSEVVDLNGVMAYQSMAHTFHVNLMPMVVFDRMDVFDEAAGLVRASRKGHGLDVYWVGMLAHRLSRVSFVSCQSWVAHVGFESTVEKQGFGPCKHSGNNLVPELKSFTKGWQSCKKI